MSRKTGPSTVTFAAAAGTLVLLAASASCTTYLEPPNWDFVDRAQLPFAGHARLAEWSGNYRFDPSIPIEVVVPAGSVRVRGAASPSILASGEASTTAPTMASPWSGSGPFEVRGTHPTQGPSIQPGRAPGSAADRYRPDDAPQAARTTLDAEPGDPYAAEMQRRYADGNGTEYVPSTTRTSPYRYGSGTVRIRAGLRMGGRSIDQAERRAAAASIVLVRELDRQVIRIAGTDRPFSADLANLDITVDRPVALRIRTDNGDVEATETFGDLDLSTERGDVRVIGHVGHVAARSGLDGGVMIRMGSPVRAAPRSERRYDTDLGYSIWANADAGQVSLEWPSGYRPAAVDVSSSRPADFGAQALRDLRWSSFAEYYSRERDVGLAADPVTAGIARAVAACMADDPGVRRRLCIEDAVTAAVIDCGHPGLAAWIADSLAPDLVALADRFEVAWTEALESYESAGPDPTGELPLGRGVGEGVPKPQADDLRRQLPFADRLRMGLGFDDRILIGPDLMACLRSATSRLEDPEQMKPSGDRDGRYSIPAELLQEVRMNARACLRAGLEPTVAAWIERQVRAKIVSSRDATGQLVGDLEAFDRSLVRVRMSGRMVERRWPLGPSEFGGPIPIRDVDPRTRPSQP